MIGRYIAKPSIATFVVIRAVAGAASVAVARDSNGIPPAIERPKGVQTSLTSSSDMPTINGLLRIDGLDILNASIGVEGENTKLSVAPFLYLFNGYSDWLSETRFQVAKDDGGVLFGVSLKKQPGSPFSKNGEKIFNEVQTKHKNRPPFDIVKYDLLRKEIEQARKADDYAKRWELQYQKNKMVEEYTTKYLNPVLFDYYELLSSHRRPTLDVTYNISLFDVIGGSYVDADTNGYNDHEHIVRKHTLTAGSTWMPRSGLQCSGLFGVQWERPSADGKSSKYGFYVNAGLLVGKRLAVLDKDYRSTKDFKESFFIPEAVLSLAWEGRFCNSNLNDCKGAIVRENVITLYLDVKMSRKGQFRLGLPYRIVKRDTTGKELAVLAQWSVQVGK